MSALGHLRVPLAAFLAAVLAGLGLGLVLQGGEEPRPAARAGSAPAVTTKLPTEQLPATPSLRVGTSPAAAPAASATPATPVTPTGGAEQQQQQPQPQQQPGGSQGNSGLQVTDESVTSP